MANYSKKRPIFKSSTDVYKKSKWAKMKEQISLNFSNIKRWLAKISYKINEKGSQRLTVMIVPHSEKKIINLQISNYILFFFTIILTVTVTTSVIAISNNQQISKELTHLKTQDEYKKAIIQDYRKSIESVNKRFTMFKGDINNIIKTVGKDENIYNFSDIKIFDEYSNKNLPREVTELEKLKRDLDVTKENIRRMGMFISSHKKLLREIPSAYPLSGPRARISSPYGGRIDPVYTWQSEFHPGQDMCTLPGTPILATADGQVSYAGWMGGYGWLVEVRHSYGFSTRYAHMKMFGMGITVGAQVKQGQTVGYVGTSGKSTGYHLHYEVRIGDKTVNPQPFTTMLP